MHNEYSLKLHKFLFSFLLWETETPNLKIYAPHSIKGGTLGLFHNKGISFFPTQWTYISLRWFLYTKFCFYFQWFLMERSREKILSRVNSMGIGLPSQVRSMIYTARILLLSAAFQAWWSSLLPQTALTLINLPRLAWNQFMFPTSFSF